MLQEQLNKIEKEFIKRFCCWNETLNSKTLYLNDLIPAKVTTDFLRTSAIELVKSVVEGIKGQEDLERLKETLKEL